jgi:hypothetical protein
MTFARPTGGPCGRRRGRRFALAARPDGGIEYLRRIGVGAFLQSFVQEETSGQIATPPDGVHHGHASPQTTGDLDPARQKARGLLRPSGPKAGRQILAGCKSLGGQSPEGHIPKMLRESTRASLAAPSGVGRRNRPAVWRRRKNYKMSPDIILSTPGKPVLVSAPNFPESH